MQPPDRPALHPAATGGRGYGGIRPRATHPFHLLPAPRDPRPMTAPSHSGTPTPRYSVTHPSPPPMANSQRLTARPQRAAQRVELTVFSRFTPNTPLARRIGEGLAVGANG